MGLAVNKRSIKSVLLWSYGIKMSPTRNKIWFNLRKENIKMQRSVNSDIAKQITFARFTVECSPRSC